MSGSHYVMAVRLCCLQKLEDEETGEIYFTDLACRMLDLEYLSLL